MWDPEPEVPALAPRYHAHSSGSGYALTSEEFDRRNDAWRSSKRVDLEAALVKTDAYRELRHAARIRDLHAAAALVLATFPITGGIIPGLGLHLGLGPPPGIPGPDPDERDLVARTLAIRGACDRWGGRPKGAAFHHGGAAAWEREHRGGGAAVGSYGIGAVDLSAAWAPEMEQLALVVATLLRCAAVAVLMVFVMAALFVALCPGARRTRGERKKRGWRRPRRNRRRGSVPFPVKRMSWDGWDVRDNPEFADTADCGSSERLSLHSGPTSPSLVCPDSSPAATNGRSSPPPTSILSRFEHVGESPASAVSSSFSNVGSIPSTPGWGEGVSPVSVLTLTQPTARVTKERTKPSGTPPTLSLDDGRNTTEGRACGSPRGRDALLKSLPPVPMGQSDCPRLQPPPPPLPLTELPPCTPPARRPPPQPARAMRGASVCLSSPPPPPPPPVRAGAGVLSPLVRPQPISGSRLPLPSVKSLSHRGSVEPGIHGGEGASGVAAGVMQGDDNEDAPTALRRSRAMGELKRAMTARSTARVRALNSAAAKATAASHRRRREDVSKEAQGDGHIGTRGNASDGIHLGVGGGARWQLDDNSDYGDKNGKKKSSSDAADILNEMRQKSPFLRAAEQEAAVHGSAISTLRAKLEALDGTADSDAIASLRAEAETTLERITDEPRVLSRLGFPIHRLESLRAAATNRSRLVALRADADALLADNGDDGASAVEVAIEVVSTDATPVAVKLLLSARSPLLREPLRGEHLKRAGCLLDKCVAFVGDLESAKTSDENRFAAAGITFDWSELQGLRESAVGMTGRCLKAALAQSWAGRTAKAESSIAAGTWTGSEGQPSKRRWGAAMTPPGAVELKTLRSACDLAYRAYMACGGVNSIMEELAGAALAEIGRYDDELWEAADSLASSA